MQLGYLEGMLWASAVWLDTGGYVWYEVCVVHSLL